MITITQNPPTINLQGQPLVFKVSSNVTDEPFFKVKAVPVYPQRELLPLNDSDEAVFDLREYFKPELAVEFKQTAYVHANACKEFTVTFYEYYGNPPQNEDSDTSAINILLGTIPKWKQMEFVAAFGTFGNWLANYIFLSWYPSQPKRVLPSQPEVLYFLAPSAATYAPTVAIIFTDGTTGSHSPVLSITPAALQVASLPVGYAALGLAAVDPTKTVASYIVTIGGKTRAYQMDYTAYNDVRYLIFRTSLGGYDVLPCTGEVDSVTETTRNIANRVYDAEATARISRYAYQIDHNEVEKVNTGWLLPNEKRWLNDLLISEDVWEMLGGVLRPVLIRNSDLDRTERNYEPGSVEIEFERLTWVE